MNLKIKIRIDSSVSNGNIFFANEYPPEYSLELDKESDEDDVQENKASD